MVAAHSVAATIFCFVEQGEFLSGQFVKTLQVGELGYTSKDCDISIVFC